MYRVIALVLAFALFGGVTAYAADDVPDLYVTAPCGCTYQIVPGDSDYEAHGPDCPALSLMDGRDAGGDVVHSRFADGLAGVLDSGVISVDSLTVNASSVELSEPEPFALIDAKPAGGVYLDCVTSQLGSIMIYVPVDYQYGSFSTVGGNVISLRASTVTGYGISGNRWYRISWSAMSTPTYRLVEGSSSTYDLTITQVKDTNVQIAASNDDFPLHPPDYVLQLLIVLLLGVILVCRFMRL